MPKIFISYRRDDSADICGRIYDHLMNHFGQEHIFRDIDAIPYGVDFTEYIQAAVTSCDALLVIIGPDWLDCRDEDGRRRLEADEDFVRTEIEVALQRKVSVIPVLVRGAAVPKKNDLPRPIRKLAVRNAAKVRPDPDFAHDLERLINGLQTLPTPQQKREEKRKARVIDSIEELGITIVSEERPLIERKFQKGHTVGIDLGTTYSAIAQVGDNGHPTVIYNADERCLTPSVVLLGDDGHVMVGPSYERIIVEDPGHIAEAIKRQMGNHEFSIGYGNEELSATVLSAIILKKLKQDAEKRIGPIGNAVITVPYYFNDVRRKATQDAGRIAGLNVIDIINEPTAATLAYAWSKGELGRAELNASDRTVLVYDLGGGTFDVAVVNFTPTHFRVLATDGDVMLGGLDWSQRIVDHISDQFQQKYGEDPREDPETMHRMSLDCEALKRELSVKSSVPVNIYYKGNSLTVYLTRTEFERMTADLLMRTEDTTQLVMQQAGIGPGAFDDVILVGGSIYMPAVVEMIRDVCGREPSCELLPEMVVAEGAAIHAAILEAKASRPTTMARAVSARFRSLGMTDVNSHSLGIKITDRNHLSGETNHIMIPRNSAIPCDVRQRFVTTGFNQRRIRITILEGDTPEVEGCSIVGELLVTNLPPKLPKGSPVEVTYSFDSEGRIGVHAKELTGNCEASTEIVRDSDISGNELMGFRDVVSRYHVE